MPLIEYNSRSCLFVSCLASFHVRKINGRRHCMQNVIKLFTILFVVAVISVPTSCSAVNFRHSVERIIKNNFLPCHFLPSIHLYVWIVAGDTQSSKCMQMDKIFSCIQLKLPQTILIHINWIKKKSRRKNGFV